MKSNEILENRLGSVSRNSRTRLWRIAFIATFVYLISRIFVSSEIAIDYDTDLGIYYTLWLALDSFSLKSLFLFEPGFVLLTELSHLVMPFPVFLALIDAFLFVSLMLFCSQMKKHLLFNFFVLLVCFIFFPPYNSLGTVVLRQGVATGIFFLYLSTVDLRTMRIRSFLGWFLVMLCFHLSSVFVLVAFWLSKRLSGLRAFHVWFIVNCLYILGISGSIGSALYSSVGLSVNSLDAFQNMKDFDYKTGFKIAFFGASVLFVLVPAILVWSRLLKVSLFELYSLPLFRLYFVLNALATFAANMPFHDRFFTWSWVLGPMLIIYSISCSTYSFGRKKERLAN